MYSRLALQTCSKRPLLTSTFIRNQTSNKPNLKQVLVKDSEEQVKKFQNTIRAPGEMDREYMKEIKEFGQSYEAPIKVQSQHSKCIVGCVCDEHEGSSARWFYLLEGPPQTCNCGVFYQLELSDTPNLYGQVMGVDTIENISTDPRLPEKSKQKFIEKHIRGENRRKIEHQLERLDYDDPRYELLKAELETTNTSGAAKTGIMHKITSFFKSKSDKMIWMEKQLGIRYLELSIIILILGKKYLKKTFV